MSDLQARSPAHCPCYADTAATSAFMADAPGVETPVMWRSDELNDPGDSMHRATSLDFWGELDADVLGCLAQRAGAMTPAEIGRTLGLSEQAVRSIVGMLAEAGKVRINAVERIV